MNNGTAARLVLQKIRREFPGTGRVVDDVDLTIEPGDFVALLGPSGSGKSTLLRLLAGLDRPDAGTLAIESFGEKHFRGFVFQEPHLLPWRDVLGNVLLPLELVGRPREEVEHEARAALARVGLADALSRLPAELSGGMRMRVSVARALVTRPSLLLLDEPFAALDENTRHLLQQQLRRLWEESRMTVVFVTHSVSEAVFLAERAVVVSARPARVLADMRIGLPGGRDAGTRTRPEFLERIRMVQAAYPAAEAVE